MGAGIAIVGYGEMGKQFESFLKGKKDRFIFFDDNAPESENVFSFLDYQLPEFSTYDFFVSLGYHHLEKKKIITDRLLQLGRQLPSFRHPSCFINGSATIEAGAFIYPMCNIDKETKIGKGVLLNNSVCISHNNLIADCCYISPGVITSGFVEIGAMTFIGAGAVIANNIKIGKNVIVGVGTVVTENLPDSCSAIGNPMRILDHKLELK
jgi:sugar O-acyltransferase (sialic acid O-acetyltransferase NeuD family)